MSLSPLTRLSLLNRLRSLQPAGLNPAAAECELPEGAELTVLELAALGAQFALVLRTAELKDQPGPAEFKALLQEFTLPPALRGAMAELCLKPYLAKAAAALETTLTVSGYGETFSAEKYPHRLSAYLKTDAKAPALTLTLCARSREAFANLLQKLDELAAAPRGTHEDTVFLEVRLTAGSAQLSLEELTSLEPGDALIIERLYLNEDRLLLLCGDFAAPAQIKEGRVLFSGPWARRAPQSRTAAAENPASLVEDAMSESGRNDGGLTGLNELKLEVSFVLDRQVLSVKELKALQPGSELTLTNADLSAVAVEVNGQQIAEGRIIDAGDRFALQILRMGK